MISNEVEILNCEALGEHDLVIVKVEQIRPEVVRMIQEKVQPRMKFPNNLLIVTSKFDIDTLPEWEFNRMGFYREKTTEQIKP